MGDNNSHPFQVQSFLLYYTEKRSTWKEDFPAFFETKKRSTKQNRAACWPPGFYADLNYFFSSFFSSSFFLPSISAIMALRFSRAFLAVSENSRGMGFTAAPTMVSMYSSENWMWRASVSGSIRSMSSR